MSEPTYTIFFKGEALEGADISAVKQHFVKLFKADDAKLAALFSGKVIALKKSLEKSEAAKFQQLFKKAGAKIYIKQDQATAPKEPEKPTEPIPVQASVTTPATPAPQKASPQSDDIPDFSIFGDSPAPSKSPETQPEDKIKAKTDAKPKAATPTSKSNQSIAASAEELDILPAGSDLLDQAEKHEFIEADIDLSSLSVANLGPLLDESIEATPAPPPPSTDHLSTAEVGSVIDTLKEEVEEVNPDISGLSMGEVGETIETLKDETEELNPDISGLSMGEVGETIETLKEDKPEIKPDTSHLSLE